MKSIEVRLLLSWQANCHTVGEPAKLSGQEAHNMKRFLVLAGFVLILTFPAHAQLGGLSVTGGGSIGNGGGINGNNASLPSYPRANFATNAFSGTEADFIPSAFLAYDQAIAAGREALAAKAITVAGAATEATGATKPRAKLAIVQDANGDPVIVPR
jgi:hypothetical protein